ncbi:MAG: hypothetical protein V8S58_06045 [Lachnospiraceae bacterium]
MEKITHYPVQVGESSESGMQPDRVTLFSQSSGKPSDQGRENQLVFFSDRRAAGSDYNSGRRK